MDQNPNAPKVTIELNKTAKRVFDFSDDSRTCEGRAYAQGTACFVNVKLPTDAQNNMQSAQLDIHGELKRALPDDWAGWQLEWQGDTTTGKDCDNQLACDFTVTVTKGGGYARLVFFTPNGRTADGFTIQPCRQGESPNGHPCDV